MKRLVIILLIINAFNINVNAYNKNVNYAPRLTFGAEWGWIGTLGSAYHYNFYSPEGYRLNERGVSLKPTGNGEANVHKKHNNVHNKRRQNE